MSMSKKLQRWFYGGQSPAFFRRQASAIHDYNVHVLSGLLVLLTAILGAYFVLSVTLSSIGEYTATYRLYLILMVALSVSFYFWGRKSIWATNLYILLFTVIAYCFMCMIGTAFHPDAPAVKGIHRNAEPSPGAADDIFFRHPTVLEYQLAGIGSANAHLVFFLAKAESGRAFFHHKAGAASGALAAVGHGKNGVDTCFTAIGDPLFGAI